MSETLERRPATAPQVTAAAPRRTAAPPFAQPAIDLRAAPQTPSSAATDRPPTPADRAALTDLDRASVHWLPLVVPGFALLMVVCIALVWDLAL